MDLAHFFSGAGHFQTELNKTKIKIVRELFLKISMFLFLEHVYAI